MTNGFRKLTAVLMLIPLALSATGGASRGQGPTQDVELSPRPSHRAEDPGQDQELSLADLTAYRAALSGKAAADSARPSDLPARVGFRDLWERSDTHRGRRVTVQGRVERIFRQGPVGSFPPLVQVWVYSTAGDPFCLVFPRPTGPTPPDQDPEHRPATLPVESHGKNAHPTPPAIPRPGQTVHFTGTFLKMVRYAAGDGPRLAPLIVGAGPPAPASRGERFPDPTTADDPGSASSSARDVLRAIGGEGPGASGPDQWAWSPASWGLALTLGAVAVAILAGQHLRGARIRTRTTRRDRLLDPDSTDPPLSFVETTQEPRV